MFKKLYKYLPDALINIGIWIFTYNVLRPPTKVGGLPSLSFTDYHTDEKMIGVIIITIGFTIATRRFLEYKKLQKQKNETMDSK